MVKHADITQKFKMAVVKPEIRVSHSYMDYLSFYTQ